jgi:putative transposase
MHANTLYGWLTLYETTGRVTSLMPRSRRDKGVQKLSVEVEAIIKSAIEEICLTPQRKPISRVCLEVRGRCQIAGNDDDAPYFRTRWRVAVLTFCPTHRILLHDRALHVLRRLPIIDAS